MKSKSLLLTTLKNNPVTYGRLFGFNKLTELHNGWIKKFLFSPEDYTLQAHRGSYKTTCLSVALALNCIFRPDLNTILLRKTDTDIKDIINTVAAILESKQAQAIVYDMYGIILKTKSSASEIKTNLYIKPTKDPQLLGLGINGSITGKHSDRIFTDDIINVKDRFSRAEREATKRSYMELENIKNPGGVIGNTGTPWHRDDAFTIMPKPVKFDYKQTGMLSDAEIESKRRKMTASLFAANYQLKHIATDDAMFTSPQYASPKDAEASKLIYNSYTHIDASYGGRDGTALTILINDNGRLFVFGKLWQSHVSKVKGQIRAYIDEYRAGTCYVENNADKGYLARELSEIGILCNTYHESQNKFYKISTHLVKHWADIQFLPGTDEDYIDQIIDYTENAEHDDAPDSLASALRLMGKQAYVL